MDSDTGSADEGRRVPVPVVVVLVFVLGVALLGAILTTVGGPSDRADTIPVTVQSDGVQSNLSVTIVETDTRGRNTTLTRNVSLAENERQQVYAFPAAQLDSVTVTVSRESGASATRRLSATDTERVEILVRSDGSVAVTGVGP